jgi:hypothetical protein
MQVRQSKFEQSKFKHLNKKSKFEQSKFEQSKFGQLKFGQLKFGQSKFEQIKFGQIKFGHLRSFRAKRRKFSCQKKCLIFCHSCLDVSSFVLSKKVSKMVSPRSQSYDRCSYKEKKLAKQTCYSTLIM